MTRGAALALFLVASLGAGYEWGGPAARGVRALRAQKYDDALRAFSEAESDLPRSAALRYNTALALEGAGRNAESDAAYREALRGRGEAARAASAFNLGTRAMSERRYRDAASWYRETLRVRPSDKEAKRALEEAIRLARDVPPAAGASGSAAAEPPPPGTGGNGAPPKPRPGTRAGSPPAGSPPRREGEFTREEAENWLDALEAERRAGRHEQRREGSRSTGGRDW